MAVIVPSALANLGTIGTKEVKNVFLFFAFFCQIFRLKQKILHDFC